ncbi:MAG: hypothetical protein V3V61_04690 [Gammaproteobacteria bacterium]
MSREAQIQARLNALVKDLKQFSKELRAKKQSQAEQPPQVEQPQAAVYESFSDPSSESVSSSLSSSSLNSSWCMVWKTNRPSDTSLIPEDFESQQLNSSLSSSTSS